MGNAMGMDEIGEYRSLLGEKPSQELLSRLWKKLGEEESREVIAYVAENLAHWPDEIERLPHYTWLSHVEEEDEVPRLALCNAVDRGLQKGSQWDKDSTWQNNPGWRNLRIAKLSTRSENIIPSIIEGSCFQNLTRLHLRDAKIDEEQASALAGWAGLESLAVLQLSFCQLTDSGLDILANSPHIGNIKELLLAGNQLTAEGLESFCASNRFDSLRVLDLRHNALGKEGAQVLGDAEFAGQLEWIHVYKEDVTGTGLKALSKSKHLPAPLRAYFKGKHP
jgi:hypothetical protein